MFKSFSNALFTLAILLVSLQAHSKDTPSVPTLQLSQVIDQGKFALDLEPKTTQSQLLEQAKAFVSFAKTPLKKRRLSSYAQTCKTNQNPFCFFVPDLLATPFKKLTSTQKKLQAPSIAPKQVQQWIEQAQIEKLSELNELTIKNSLKAISSFSQITELTSKLNESSSCHHSLLSSLLASKSEEFLPDEPAKKTAMQLYQKVAQCSSVESLNIRARFRLSLLHIWADQCKSALPHLQFLSQHTDSLNDYRSRALYWQWQCQSTLKNKRESDQAKQTLLEQYPFSFHTLLVQGEDLEHQVPKKISQDSTLTTRLESSIELNQKISAIEALMKLKENHIAKRFLRTLESDITKSEPSFQLYVAALFHHLSDSLMQFKLLTSIFKETPSLISRKSLQLYYPHKSFGSRDFYTSELDEMLILALIRQESAFNPEARSAAGALGLMQVMPQTAKRFERIRTLKELFKPSLNVKIGTRYFSNLLKSFNGDTGLALAAYNAGPKKVEDWMRRYPVKDKVLFLDLIPYKETREYVACIARNYYWYTSIYHEDRSKAAVSQRTLNKVFTLSGS